MVEQVSPHTNRGQFLDLQHPSSCNGNITAWHFCYYTSGVSVSTDTFSLWFRVWRPERAGVLRLVHDYQVSSTIDSLDTELPFDCGNIVLQESDYLEVEEDDIIGVYTSMRSTNVPIIGQNAPAESVLHFDRRNNFDSDTVRRRDLSETPSLVLHLYAHIGKNIRVPFLYYICQEQLTIRYLHELCSTCVFVKITSLSFPYRSPTAE